MKQVIGITGGIASGKSTVTAYLRQQGYPVLDADQLVHELQKKGNPLYQLLVATFGKTILTEQGELDRPTLSAQVFANPGLREKLSTLQDETIRREILTRRDSLLQEHDLVFMDIPLLFEKSYETECDQVWLVYVPEEVQLNRLMKRNNYTYQEALQRLQAQWPIDTKKDQADYVIDNQGSLDSTYEQVKTALAGLESRG